ncbi:YafY family protein [Pelagicoccus enzymogenes]|uniref:helix-turn-helix transcriptional regulator n=1 Tax=Pelagicoccus enzymogenes TaxID=2773457 RepID=UPI00280D82F8|nr:YafY family protein [Pelagicoccus enzymogenes]MDQ8200342.1 YafY family protein [Pelagicoccus enzymogenes]
MNRIDRLMGTMLLLQSRRVTRAEDIAAHFEISLRTVYRDVSALSEIGIPVVAEAGVGYSLMKGYLLPPIMFSENEAAALGMAGLALSKTSDPSLDASIQSAILKVKAALPERQRRRLERVEESVVFRWSSHAPKPDGAIARLVDLQAALAESRALRISYQAGGCGEVTTREVEPLGMIHYLDYWHLIAWCCLREDYRDFRIDRIQKLEVLNRKAIRCSDFDLQAYLAKEKEHTESLEARLLFSRYSAGRGRREWSLGLVEEEERQDGVLLTLRTGSYEWMTGWLLSFREDVRVVDPPELRELLAEAARKLAEHHASD